MYVSSSGWEGAVFDGFELTGAVFVQLYKTTESPRYVKGHAVTLAMVGFASCVYGFMSWYFARENRRRKEGKEDGKIVGMTEEDIAEMGDRNPRYIYTT